MNTTTEKKFCVTTDDLVNKYFQAMPGTYKAAGLEFCIISLLSDVQSLLITSNESDVNKAYYNALLNDIKSVLSHRNDAVEEVKEDVKPQVVKKATFDEIYEEAEKAGVEAANTCIPGTTGPTNSFATEGCCGFAWVKIRPATSPFAKWLKATGKVTHVAYGGGYDIWCRCGGQSMTRKEAWADAFVTVLKKHGIEGVAQSRMD